jgi:hypothetical protein
MLRGVGDGLFMGWGISFDSGAASLAGLRFCIPSRRRGRAFYGAFRLILALPPGSFSAG